MKLGRDTGSVWRIVETNRSIIAMLLSVFAYKKGSPARLSGEDILVKSEVYNAVHVADKHSRSTLDIQT